MCVKIKGEYFDFVKGENICRSTYPAGRVTLEKFLEACCCWENDIMMMILIVSVSIFRDHQSRYICFTLQNKWISMFHKPLIMLCLYSNTTTTTVYMYLIFFRSDKISFGQTRILSLSDRKSGKVFSSFAKPDRIGVTLIWHSI